ncbi:acylneuraminate cytidylyltransferase family protein [Candidatus Pelagibacter sp.]|jgi:CMP-N,N'-diacetyllegionaminic acid synthase|nr:acylneuraminate cytidylyltransferase family protein [Candidatus Pelagibacter sp.]
MKPVVIAIIPARSGSKGIKNKNIKIFKKKPLIYWSIKSCIESKIIKKIYVSTDSKKYAKISIDSGADKIIMRPKKISKDKSTDLEFITHAMKNISINYDIIAHIRPTTPLRKKGLIDLAIKKFIKSKNNSLRTVNEMSETAYKTFEIRDNLLKGICNSSKTLDDLNAPRQFFKKTYSANGVVDLYKKDFVLKNKKLFGKKSMAFVTDFTNEIDTLHQFKYLEFLKK